MSTTGVSVTKTGNATAGTPTIDNSSNPTIKDLNASFTAPGEKVEYTFYARNEGSYDAYLSSVVFNNINGKSVFKECVAGEGTTSSMVASACNGIKVTTTVLSTSYTDTTLNITNHLLKKNNSELVKVTIEYVSGLAVADGPFTINFGNIYLTYGSTSLSGMPTLPTEPICTAVTEATTGNVSEGKYVAVDEYICDAGDGENKIFFVLETSGDNVSLIMNANVGNDGKIVTSDSTNHPSLVAWAIEEDYIAAGGTESDYGRYENNDKGPLTAIKTLKEYTSTWTNITQSQISLPTKEQIYKASGNSESSLAIWLNDYLQTFIHSVDMVLGYWTGTAYADDSSLAWMINDTDGLRVQSIYCVTNYGIRPVITIPKSNIS